MNGESPKGLGGSSSSRSPSGEKGLRSETPT
jgi:hypothetical protein